MKSILVFLLVSMIFISFAGSSSAAVNVQRSGSENPVQEIAKSTMWGGIAGLLVGGAITLMSTENENDGEILRWGFVGGTFFGLGYGIYHVHSRPPARALLEVGEGKAELAVPTLTMEPERGARVVLVGGRF